MATTNRKLKLELWGSKVTLPAGTQVRRVSVADGTGQSEGYQYAVESIKLLADLTGNTHDPKYRYAFVPTDAVTDNAS